MEWRRLKTQDPSSWSTMEKEKLEFRDGRVKALRNRVKARGGIADDVMRERVKVES